MPQEIMIVTIFLLTQIICQWNYYSVTTDIHYRNLFYANDSSLNPLKTSENLRYSGGMKWNIGVKWLNTILITIKSFMKKAPIT